MHLRSRMDESEASHVGVEWSYQGTRDLPRSMAEVGEEAAVPMHETC